MDVRVKRAYAQPARNDGFRALVDRVWPRGVRKEDARIDAWWKAVAPSTRLRKWFGHDPERWEEFQRRYFAELDEMADEKAEEDGALAELLSRARRGRVTLVYGARDEEHNNAVALRSYLRRRIGS